MLRFAIWLLLAGLGLVAVYGWLRRGLGRARRARREEAAARAALTTLPGLADELRQAAQATGKPRGLIWRRCDLSPSVPLVARDTATGELVALAGVTVAFEADPAGDMTEVPAVADLRDATAVFAWRDGRWTTDGRVVFNLSPEGTLKRYGDTLQAVGRGTRG